MARLLLVCAILVFGLLLGLRFVNRNSSSVEPEARPTDLAVYKNTKFGFEFYYRPDLQLMTDPDAQLPGDPELASDVVVGPAFTPANRLPEELEIVLYDRKSKDSDSYNDPPGFWSPGLNDRIPLIYRMIAEEQPVGPVATATLAGEEAFEFTVREGIGWNGLGRAVDEQNLLVFLENTDTVFQISLPNTSTFNEILQTFRLTSSRGG